MMIFIISFAVGDDVDVKASTLTIAQIQNVIFLVQKSLCTVSHDLSTYDQTQILCDECVRSSKKKSWLQR